MGSFDHDAADALLDLAAEASDDLLASALTAGLGGSAAGYASILRDDVVPILEDYADSARVLSDEVVQQAITVGLTAKDLRNYRAANASGFDSLSWRESLLKGIGWALSPLFGPDGKPIDDVNTGMRLAHKRARQVADGAVKQPARDVVHDSVRAVNRGRTGGHRGPARWYRRNRADACAFCLMLASRGPVYSSEAAAGDYGNHYHADCRCTPTIFLPGDDLAPDYDLTALRDQYYRAQKDAQGTDLAQRPTSRKKDNDKFREQLRNIRAQGHY